MHAPRHQMLPKIALAVYLLTLLWLILFKLSFDILGVLDFQQASVNLIPFIGSQGISREMIDNLVIFVPLGLLMGVNLKQTNFWHKLAAVFGISLTVEILQLALAIGITDITDLIMNTLGGFVGLVLYQVGNKYIETTKLDKFIAIISIILLVALILYRVLFLRVRY